MVGKRRGFLYQPAVERRFGLDRQQGVVFPNLCKTLLERLDQLDMLKRGTVLILQEGDGAHGKALLWDAHSIASEIPGLFAGVLPEFNLGTRDGASCPREISEALLQIVARDGEFGVVLDGRFKGGYITDHYGKPGNGVYAVQLELARRAYMNEAVEQVWDPQRAERAQALILRLLSKYLST